MMRRMLATLLTAFVVVGLGDAAGAARALHTDTSGSVIEMTDGSGASVGVASFEPYGVERGRSGARSVLGWEGQLQDVAGSYHLRARQYHPDLGQFVAPDPARAVLDSATYSYANSNPMTTSDPLGLWPTDGTIGDALHYAGSNVAGMFGVGVVLQAFRACEGTEKGSCGADVVAMAVVGGAGKGLGKAARAVRSADDAADIGHAGLRHQFPNTLRGKSQFFDGVDLSGLASRTKGVRGLLQSNGNTRYVFRNPDAVGVDRTTGLPTHVFTVIRGADGSVVTMFPGTSPKG